MHRGTTVRPDETSGGDCLARWRMRLAGLCLSFFPSQLFSLFLLVYHRQEAKEMGRPFEIIHIQQRSGG